EAFLLLLFAYRRVGRRVGEAHAQCFDRSSHGVCGIHTAAGPCTRAGVFYNAEEVLIRELTSYFLPQSLECRHDVQVLPFIVAWGDGAAIYHDGWSIEPGHRHDGSRHIFVTAGNGDDSIIILASADGFDAIGNDIAAYQRVSHAIRAVAHPVAHTDRVEYEAYEVISPYALLYDLCQVVEMPVAGVPVIAHAGNTYLRFLHVVVR